MYEYITGRIETLTPASVVVEAAGVGYFLNISLQTFSQIGSRTEVKLYAHFAVREDAQVLYGFFSRAERDIFRSLIGVSGVGGNTARMIDRTGRRAEDRQGTRSENRAENHRGIAG